jgi:subtilase-type serine protease
MMERVPMNEFVRRGESRAKVSRKVVELLGGVSLLVLTATPALAQDDTLRIISLNTWGKSSLAPEAVDLFTKGNYDIITIQEYNSSYGNDLSTKLLASEAGAFSLHAMGDKAVASRLPGTGGLGGVRQTPYVKLPANGGLPATIVATEHLNYYDNAFSYRVGQAKELNDWAGDEASPIILTGDFNAGDISERGLLEVVQQELLLTRARETGNTDHKAWALQYVARNHPIGSEAYAAAEAYLNGTSDTRPTGLFTDETYPVEGNTPYTLNILKKEFQILQNPQDRERFAPHKLADGSTTWPSIGEDDEAFKWPSWGRTQIDHFVVSRPYAKWWELADPANDPYTGGVVGQSVSTTAGGIPLSDHEPVAHEIRWIGPKVEEIGGGSGSVRLTFDAGTGGPAPRMSSGCRATTTVRTSIWASFPMPTGCRSTGRRKKSHGTGWPSCSPIAPTIAMTRRLFSSSSHRMCPTSSRASTKGTLPNCSILPDPTTTEPSSRTISTRIATNFRGSTASPA